jgi:hypothetical protein
MRDHKSSYAIPNKTFLAVWNHHKSFLLVFPFLLSILSISPYQDLNPKGLKLLEAGRLLGFESLYAQEIVEISFDLNEEPGGTAITVGDAFTLLLEIRHPAGSQVTIPALPHEWGTFEVRAQSAAQTESLPDGRLRTTQQITAALFEPGSHTTPAFEITFQAADGSLAGYLVPPLTVMVRSVLEGDDSELRDIRPQAEIDAPFRWGWLLVFGLVALAAWRLWAHRAQPAPAEAPAQPSPRQVALDELDRIEALALPEQGRFKEFYSRLDACLRRCLEDPFNLQAVNRTTTEIARELVDTGLSPQGTDVLLGLLRASDRVKFARHTPEVETAQAHLQAARRWVESSIPVPPAADQEILHPGSPEDAA